MIPIHRASQTLFHWTSRYALQLHRNVQKLHLYSIRLSQSTRPSCQGYSNISKGYCDKNDHLVVVGTGGNELNPTLCLIGNKRRYWFNCCEGTSRWLKMYYLRHGEPIMFITRASWNNVVGLNGLHAEYKKFTEEKRKYQYMGPLKCKQIFSVLMSKCLGSAAFKTIDNYQDESFTISSVPLGNKDDLVAYSCKKQDSTGSIDVKKAISLGVPDGPALRALKNGKEYVTDTGNVVKPCQVVGPSKKGATFIILECPDQSFIDSVCTHKQLQLSYFKDRKEKLEFVVHITPLNILETDKYCSWMASFGPGVHHVLLHSSVCPAEVSWREAMEFSMPFHLMNPEVYHFPSIPEKNDITWSNLKMRKYLFDNQVTIGRTGLRYVMKNGQNALLDFSKTLPPLEENLEKIHSKALKYCGSSIKSYQRSVHGRVQNIGDNFTENACPPSVLTDSTDCMVTFLGTGASGSSKRRNQSGILLQTLSEGNILLDCGEGTITQLQKCFGVQRACEILSKISTIFISHNHNDHWFGLLELLRQLLAIEGVRNRVTVIAPCFFKGVGDSYRSLFSDIDYNFMDCAHTAKIPVIQNNLILKTIRVNHIKDSFGIKVGRGNDWSIVYSGDTQPCLNLVKEGRNSSLLIHEGTYDDDRDVTEVARERHSFYGEAVRASKACNASFTAITHFSELFSPYSLKKPPTPLVVPAVDFMSLKLSDIQRHRLDSIECAHVFNSIQRMIVFSKYHS